jgi:hypothetical protein
MSRNEAKLKDFVESLPRPNADQKHQYLVVDFRILKTIKK